MKILKMSDLDLKGKRVLIRQDLNVPMVDGQVTSRVRVEEALPALKAALDAGARVMTMSHLGRPVEGRVDAEHSLTPVAGILSELLGQPVPLRTDWLDGPVDVAPGEMVLLENVRFNQGEKANDEALAKKMARLCDIFVMDAFGTAHRAQASTHGVARFAPVACAGPLLCKELDALSAALENPKRPLVVIVGGSKVSSKLTLLENLSHVADRIILGGGIANTFLAAEGAPIGTSLCEPNLLDTARRIHAAIRERGGELVLPTDVVVAPELDSEAHAEVRPVNEVEADEMILDFGPQSRASVHALLQGAATILWNGPLGVFEFEQFSGGTRALAQSVAQSPAYSIAGGGDTLSAIHLFGVEQEISCISTGGGAFLEFMEGKTLPAVAVLEARARQAA